MGTENNSAWEHLRKTKGVNIYALPGGVSVVQAASGKYLLRKLQYWICAINTAQLRIVFFVSRKPKSVN